MATQMKIKKGDIVQVLAGKDRGQAGPGARRVARASGASSSRA